MAHLLMEVGEAMTHVHGTECQSSTAPSPYDLGPAVSSIPDECERDLLGDSNFDQIVDLTDHSLLVDCLAGSDAATGYAECFDLCLAAFDFDHDEDPRDAGALNVPF